MVDSKENYNFDLGVKGLIPSVTLDGSHTNKIYKMCTREKMLYFWMLSLAYPFWIAKQFGFPFNILTPKSY